MDAVSLQFAWVNGSEGNSTIIAIAINSERLLRSSSIASVYSGRMSTSYYTIFDRDVTKGPQSVVTRFQGSEATQYWLRN